MSTYKELKGTTVDILTADPPTSLAQGAMWYRSSANAYKMGGKAASWSAGGTNLWPWVGCPSGGTQTAAFCAAGAGTSPPAPAGNPQALVYYNGTAWTNQSNNSPGNESYQSGAGIQDECFVGYGRGPLPLSSTVAYFNGTSWTSSAGGGGRRYGAGFGTGSAAIMCGGGGWPWNYPGAFSEEWNGSSWTATNALSQGRASDNAATGVESAGMLVGGGTFHSPSPGIHTYFDYTEEYNGTSWSSGGNLPNPSSQAGCGGPITAAVAAGGNAPAIGGANNVVIQYNGTAWSALNNTAIARAAGGTAKSGTLTAFMVTGGNAPSVPGATDSTEELSEVDGVLTISTS